MFDMKIMAQNHFRTLKIEIDRIKNWTKLASYINFKREKILYVKFGTQQPNFGQYKMVSCTS